MIFLVCYVKNEVYILFLTPFLKSWSKKLKVAPYTFMIFNVTINIFSVYKAHFLQWNCIKYRTVWHFMQRQKILFSKICGDINDSIVHAPSLPGLNINNFLQQCFCSSDIYFTQRRSEYIWWNIEYHMFLKF